MVTYYFIFLKWLNYNSNTIYGYSICSTIFTMTSEFPFKELKLSIHAKWNCGILRTIFLQRKHVVFQSQEGYIQCQVWCEENTLRIRQSKTECVKWNISLVTGNINISTFSSCVSHCAFFSFPFSSIFVESEHGNECCMLDAIYASNFGSLSPSLTLPDFLAFISLFLPEFLQCLSSEIRSFVLRWTILWT